MNKLTYKTIILSDVHLGTPHCKINEVNEFLKHTRCERLILNGDIIDAWQLSRSGKWETSHTRFVRLILKKMEKQGTEVIYLRGNHDDLLRRFMPMDFVNIQIREDYVLKTLTGKEYLVLHGDVFDLVTTHLKILSHVGDFGYQWLLRFNRLYSRWWRWKGKGNFSLSQYIKSRVKSAVSFISNYEDQFVKLAKSKGYDGVMCGHIHTPDDKIIDGVHYMNSGDWVESLTSIVEHDDGTLQVLSYEDFQKQLLKQASEVSEKDCPAEAFISEVVA
ncbi:MAG TPA: UDP-2,3-diacylglucosamine hydrolase [Opitutae bacterium]|nr:UDP-2,3-diacylglucosamine hydrolase [Opitutae bacterium]